MDGDWVIAIGVLLSICAAVTTIGGAVKTLKEIGKPYETLKRRVAELSEANEEMQDEVERLETRIKSYVDLTNKENNENVQKINKDISFLKKKIEKNETDTKLILKQLLAIGGVMVDPNDESSRDKIRQANCDLVEHLIEK